MVIKNQEAITQVSQTLTVFVKGDPREWIEQWQRDHPENHIHQISIEDNRVEIRFSRKRKLGEQ